MSRSEYDKTRFRIVEYSWYNKLTCAMRYSYIIQELVPVWWKLFIGKGWVTYRESYHSDSSFIYETDNFDKAFAKMKSITDARNWSSRRRCVVAYLDSAGDRTNE